MCVRRRLGELRRCGSWYLCNYAGVLNRIVVETPTTIPDSANEESPAPNPRGKTAAGRDPGGQGGRPEIVLVVDFLRTASSCFRKWIFLTTSTQLVASQSQFQAIHG